MEGLASGTYDWRVKGPKYLANSGSLVLTGLHPGRSGTYNLRTFELSNLQTLEAGSMKAGDCNNDNAVNITDFSILKSSFGKANGDPGYDERADFTGDNAVNISDFSILKNNFGLGGAPPINPTTASK